MSYETFGPTYPPKPEVPPPSPEKLAEAKARFKVVEKVSVLPVITTLDLPSQTVLEAALKTSLDGCVVIGVDETGELYFASSFADGGDVLWWLEKAKLALLTMEMSR